MSVPDTRLFHLHYHVPDVGYAEQVLDGIGLPLRAKFGTVNEEMVAVEAGEEPPAGFQFRLQDAQRGHANITLTPGRAVRFDHLGIVTAEFDSIVRRATDATWTVQGIDDPRTFLITPWGFRIELHPEDARVVDSLGSWDECRFDEAVLAVPDSKEVREGLGTVVGQISGVRIRETDGRPQVPRAVLGGRAVQAGSTLHAAALAPGSDSVGDEGTG